MFDTSTHLLFLHKLYIGEREKVKYLLVLSSELHNRDEKLIILSDTK